MTLDQALRVSAALLAAAGLTALVLTGEVPLALFLGAYGCGVASIARAFGWGERWWIFHLSRGVWNAVVLVMFVVFVVEFIWLDPGLLPPSVHFLIVLMSHKLLTLDQRKDFPQLYALSLLALLAAAALTVDLWYASVTAAFMVAAVWSLMLFHLVSERERQQGTGKALFRPGHVAAESHALTMRLFWTTNGIACGGLCLMIGIFFLTPRIGAGLFQKQRLDLIRTTGFSDRVELGVIGAVKLDQTVVMRVELPELIGPPPERLYFRGVAYDQYNGNSWANSFPHRYSISRNVEGVFKLDAQTRGAQDSEGLRQDILIEALDTPALFGVPFIRSVEGNFFVVQTDGMGGLYLTHPPATRLQYTVYSRASSLQPEERLATSYAYPDEIRRYYLQLPPDTTRVRALAKEVAGSSATVFERVTAIQRHLRSTYAYSLDVGATLPDNPVDEFLFVRKTGYCEHYATAMVLMLRAVGIPARLVTGFLHGEWNDFGNYFTVRQRDAHAWVEVYFPQSGWRTFDPTPTAGVGSVMPAWSQAVRLMDSVRLKWDRFVIRYSLRDQVTVMRGIRERGEKVRDQLAGILTAVRQWISRGPSQLAAFAGPGRSAAAGGILAVAFVAAMVMLLHWRRRRRVARFQSQSSVHSAHQATAVRMYGRMLQLLEARGLRKSAGATPIEFSREVSRRSVVLGEPVRLLTGLYCRIRFGSEDMSTDDQERADELLGRLRSAQ